MNVLFLTMAKVDVDGGGIYGDLMWKFRDEGHSVYMVYPVERREGRGTSYVSDGSVHSLGVKTLNVQKTGIIEKGLGQLSLGLLFSRGINKYMKGVAFDLILYSTPPITLVSVVKHMKKRFPGAESYLLLKDIFPQNAIDLGMLSKTGLKGLLYKYFRSQEKQLYQLSDHIGCMSPANAGYLVDNNPDVDRSKVEVNPNSIRILPEENAGDGSEVLRKYGLPEDRPVFIYGGNLGEPQGIPFLIKCLDANKDRSDCHFLIVGSGTYYDELAGWYDDNRGGAVTIMKGLPKKEYDSLVKACHAGLIFLDFRFTIPNYPSRLLSYLQFSKPVVVCSDTVCDMGSIAEASGFGMWCPSNDVESFTKTIDRMLASDMSYMGGAGRRFLEEQYSVDNSYGLIINRMRDRQKDNQ